ncbi:MAG: hypothetical protein ACTSPY_07975 [Candidatus Helarchaeota archaeon]
MVFRSTHTDHTVSWWGWLILQVLVVTPKLHSSLDDTPISCKGLCTP